MGSLPGLSDGFTRILQRETSHAGGQGEDWACRTRTWARGLQRQNQLPAVLSAYVASNLSKHLPACADRDALAHMFNEPLTTKQMKSFRRNLEIYGLTTADFVRLFAGQGGLCAI